MFHLYVEAGDWGWLSMLAHSPPLQFVIELPDSHMTGAKGVVLVRASWYETTGSLGLPFDVNQSLMVLGLSWFGCNSCSARWTVF